jgi:peroxiredoxin Q/BCP
MKKNKSGFMKTYGIYGLFILLVCGLSLAFSHAGTRNNKKNEKSDMASIKLGSKLPAFSLKDQHGQVFDVSSVLGKKNLVIYFYPKDDSPGCTREACYFRDQYEVFSQADAMIIGISGQSVESHRKFAEKYRLSYTLLSDEDNQVRKLFGVPASLFGTLPGRVTYVADKTGTVVYVFNSQSQATRHVDEALRILKEMK